MLRPEEKKLYKQNIRYGEAERYGTVWYITAFYGTVQHSMVQYNMVHYGTYGNVQRSCFSLDTFSWQLAQLLNRFVSLVYLFFYNS